MRAALYLAKPPSSQPLSGGLRGLLRHGIAAVAAAFLWGGGATADAAELLMVDRPGCPYCIEWEDKIGPIYPKSAAGIFAPLRHIDISDLPPKDITLTRSVAFTPTFLLIEDAREIGRIEGYPGEDFFWGLLEKMLREETDFDG